MIGRWGKGLAVVALGLAVVADLGLAAGLLDEAPRDVTLAWTALSALPGPSPGLALAGRRALADAGVAGAAAAAAGLILGSAAACLPGPSRAVLVALLRLPALCVALIGVLGAAMVLAGSGPAAAALVGFTVATRTLDPRWTLAILLLPLAVALIEPAARRLNRLGFETLATLGFGPLRRLFGHAVPAVMPSVAKSAVICFLIALAGLFAAAWPVAARQSQVAMLAADVAARPIAALAFCGALALAVLGALVSRAPE